MKKLLLSTLAVLGLAGTAFAGSGTQADPYSVDDVVEMGSNANVPGIYVKGYIVGFINGMSYTDAVFGLPTADQNQTNIILAGSSAENDIKYCLPVQLPAGAVRTNLNLWANPDVLGHQVILGGDIIKYFGQIGIKNTKSYEWVGNAPELGTGGGSGTGGGNTGGNDDAYLTSGLEPFTVDNVTLPEDLTYVWSWDSQYGAKASAFYNSTNFATESYLISPELTLAADTKSATFSQALNFLNGNNRADYVNVVVREGNGAWQTVNVSAWPEGTGWGFVDDCEIDLSAYAGKTIQLAFRYTSSSSCAPTWEVKRLKIGATATGGGNTPSTPTDVWTVAKALEQINSGYEGPAQVQGYVTSITEISVDFGNATYAIADAQGGSPTLGVYRGKYLNNASFTSTDQLKVGDLVVVTGELVNYKGNTPQFTTGNYLVSINDETSGGGNGGGDNPNPNPNPGTPTGESVTFDFAHPETLGISYVPEEQENNLTGMTIVNAPVSISFANNGTGTEPRLWYASGNYTMRFYKDNVLTISVPSEYVLTGIEFNGTNLGKDWTYSNGSLSGSTWTPNGAVSTVEIGKSATGNNPTVKTMTVYYADAAGVDEILAADDAEAVYFNLQGVKVANPENGIFIKVVGNKAVKVVK